MIETPVESPVPRLELSEWRAHGVVAGITGRGTERDPFDLGLAGVRTPVGSVMENWRRLLESFPEFSAVVLSRQAHGTRIRWQEPAQGLVIQHGFDGHAIEAPGVLVAVTVADCIPIYLVDPAGRRAALLHAGWRGTAAGILASGITELRTRGSLVENLLMHCGVGICGNCYEVGSEVFAACGLPPPTQGKGRFDLRSVLSQQANVEGVLHVSQTSHCSAHDSSLFFSHRGSGGLDGRMVAYLGFVE